MSGKKLAMCILTGILLLVPSAAILSAGTDSIVAEAADEDFVVDKNGVLREYSGTDKDVTIPETVGGVKVTSIGDDAFKGNDDIQSVTIPDSVTSIEGYAFYGCDGLKTIKMPSRLENIGYRTFQGCTGLTSVTIPDGVTNIADGAFYGCSSLTSIKLPDSVITIGTSDRVDLDGVFEGCSGLTNIVIPDGVTSIGAMAFSGCSSLTSVTIPNGVISIGSAAFDDCKNLTSLTIPNSVSKIESIFVNHRYNSNLVIHGASGSQAEIYAVAQGIPFEVNMGYEEANGGRWAESGGRWWFRHTDGSYTKNGIELIAGKKYCFDSSGWIVTGWYHLGNNWYYMDDYGVVTTGWQKIGDKSYYMDENGIWIEDAEPGVNVPMGPPISSLSPAPGSTTPSQSYGLEHASQSSISKAFASYVGEDLSQQLTKVINDLNIHGSVENYIGIYCVTADDFDEDGYVEFSASGAGQEDWYVIYYVGDSWNVVPAQVTRYGGVTAKMTSPSPVAVAVRVNLDLKYGKWQQSGSRWWYRHTDGSFTTDDWELIDGKWYYFDESGWMVTGWRQVGGTWYYMYPSGEIASNTVIDGCYLDASGAWVQDGSQGGNGSSSTISAGWVQSGDLWWYQNADGSYPANAWKQIGGTWYYFDASGWMATDWRQVDGNWYYLDASGAMQTGWLQLGDTWYYLYENGAMAANTTIDGYYLDASGVWVQDANQGQTGGSSASEGWVQSGNLWWYQNVDGSYPANCWKQIGGTWYYFDAAGWMATGWQYVDGAWYYMDASGAMQTGWLQLDDTWYFLYDNGAMAVDAYVGANGEYYVDANGVWVQ